jgi:hypothetical protein
VRKPRRNSSSARASSTFRARGPHLGLGRLVVRLRDGRLPAERLGREHAVVQRLSGDALELLARALGVAERLERAPAPVGPGEVQARGRRHGLDRLEHRAPASRAQRRARLPRELRVLERGVARARVPLERLVAVRERGERREARPQVAAFLRRQARRRARVHRLGGGRQVAAREAQHREHDHLAHRPRIQRARGLREQLPRRAQRAREQPLVGPRRSGQPLQRAPRRGHVAVIDEQPRAQPDPLRFAGVAREQLVGELLAAIGELLGLEPYGARFERGLRVAAREARAPRVTADLEVVADQRPERTLEGAPVGAPAELAQPVGAHLLGEIGARVAPEVALDLVVRDVLDRYAQPPVLRPRLEHVARERARVPLEPLGVARAIRVVGAEHRLVVSSRCARGGERAGECYIQETPINHVLRIARREWTQACKFGGKPSAPG